MKNLIKIIILLFALNVGAQSTSTAKIYTKGNYFIVEQNDKEYSAPMKDVIIYQLTVDSEFYYFKNLENWTNNGLKVVNMVDESGTPYTTQTWETFYTENTGSFNNGGGSGVGLNWESTGVYAVNDIVNYAGIFYKNLTGVNTSTSPDTDTTNWEALPPSSFISDTDGDTGVYTEKTAGENKIRFDTSGSQRMIIDEAGQIGVGTNLPTQKLDVNGNARLRGNLDLTNANSVITGETGLTIQQTGDVFGGTALYIRNRSGQGGVILEQLGITDVLDFGFKTLSSQMNVRVEDRAQEVFFSDPEFQFMLEGDRFASLGVNGSDEAALLLRGNNGSKGAVYFGNIGHGVKRGFANAVNNVGLYTTSGNVVLSTNGETEGEFVLTDGGNVGIGTIAPSEKLHVIGNSILSGNTTINGETKLLKASNNILTVGDDSYTNKYLTLRDGANYAAKWGLQANNNVGSSGSNLTISSKDIAFKAGVPNATDYANVTDAHLFIQTVTGNVGIGTNTPTQALDVNGNARIREALFDSNNQSGTAGQVLSSTTTGTDWVTLTEAYGGFSSLETQTFAANTATPITFNHTDQIKNIGHSETVDNSEFTFQVAGEYSMNIEPQLLRNSGSAGGGTLDVWVQIDIGAGFVNIDNSNIKRTVSGSQSTGISPLTITIDAVVGEKVRFMAYVDETVLELHYTAPAAPRPATPSVILNISRIGN